VKQEAYRKKGKNKMAAIKQEWQAGGKGGNKWFPENAPQQGKASKGKPKKKK
jgi:hypothetical protein